MKKRELPPAVARCCRVLRQAGHQAYPVGGCVRDLLLGRVPQDWDVTTSALPQQVESLFPRTLPTGLRHGTVSVLEEGECIEVTTFRRETGYADHRHPDRVEFVPELREDLARRDFTVNAMALGESGEVIDFFDGQADLKGGILRCVGEPDLRFQEDALRMLRAVRFSAQLGFQIQGETLAAMERQAHLARRLSAERVRVEVEKTICAPRPEQGELLFRLGLLEGYTSRRQVELTGLLGLENLAMLRWAGLCALLELGEGTGEFLTRLRLDGGTVRACRAGARLFANGLPEDGRAWRHALAQAGLMGCRAAAAMGDAREGGRDAKRSIKCPSGRRGPLYAPPAGVERRRAVPAGPARTGDRPGPGQAAGTCAGAAGGQSKGRPPNHFGGRPRGRFFNGPGTEGGRGRSPLTSAL